MMLLRQSLSPKAQKSDKELCVLTESFLLHSWDSEAAWGQIHHTEQKAAL